MNGEEKKFFEQYKILCRKCGGERVTMDIEPFVDYGGETGSSGGYITFGCPDCEKNDFFLDPQL